MVKRGVVKNTTYLTLAYVGQKVLSFVYFVMIARFIGVEDLGKYSFALAFTTMFAVFIDIGLTQALIREVAKHFEKAGKYIASIMSVKLLLSLVVYAVVVVAVNVMGYLPVTKLLVYLSGIIMILDSLTLSFWGIFRGSQNLKYESIGIVVNQIIIISLGLVVLLFRLPLPYLMLPFIVGSFWNVLFSTTMMRRRLGIKLQLEWDKNVLRFLFKIAVPFALLGIFTRVYGYIDSVLLSFLQGDSAIGWYSTAMKIPFALQFIPAAFAAAIYPAFSAYFIRDKGKLRFIFDKSMLILMLIAVPISFGVASIAPEVILFVFGDDFRNSIMPLQLLVFSLPFVFMNFPIGALMNGCERHVTNTKLVGMTMVVNIVLNVILIPLYSYNGAAIAFLISHSFLFVSGLLVAHQIIDFKGNKLVSSALRTVLSGAIMGVLIMLLKPHINFIVLIFFGAVVYMVSLYVLKGFTKQDIKYLKESILNKNA